MIQQNGKTLLEVRGLRATVNGIEILKGIDLTVRSGEVHAHHGAERLGQEHLRQGARRPSRPTRSPAARSCSKARTCSS